MQGAELFRDIPVAGDLAALEICGLTHDSRSVREGDLYTALVGDRFDGRDFAGEAFGRGAVAVLAEGERPSGVEGRWLTVANPRRWLGPLAARLHGHPDRDLTMVGVTGTNGKTTVTALLASILNAAGRESALLGTLGYSYAGRILPAARTTPEAPELFAFLGEVRDRGGQAAVMEVSSHALDLHRVAGAAFDLALFNNLSRDHLDFHGEFDTYFGAKRKLFTQLKPDGVAVVNGDDAYGRKLADEFGTRAVVFGGEGSVRYTATELSETGLDAEVQTPHGSLHVRSPLLGRYNAMNILATVAAAGALGIDHHAIAHGVSKVPPLPGRLEPVDGGQPFPVFIDYAHTEAALVAALKSVRELSPRKVLVVFGCGGDRDRGKREPMGEAAGRYADRCIITNDNPRGEDPQRILKAIEQGVRRSGNGNYEVIPDRRQAIDRALTVADAGWIVVLAGKGHEAEQVVGDRTLPFSDRRVAEEILEGNFGAGHAH